VQSDAGPIGTLWAFDRRLRTPEDREIHVVQSIAAQVAVLLERVVLLRESADQHRLQRDLQVASECQSPEMLGAAIGNLNFDAAAVCTSRYELGGDLCELVRLDATRTAIAVGDASGDSVPAALVMSAVRGALRTLSSYGIEDVQRTDSVMRRLHASGEKISAMESHGMLLGVMEDATYKRSVLKLEPRDTLVFYSDGISEAMNGRRKLFRSDGILGAMKGRAAGTAQEILQCIWSQLEEHTGRDGEGDDRTLLVVKMPAAVDQEMPINEGRRSR
jgi:sigma-B regulation protein RsbU (phosphoserine phosphatase)